MRQSLMIRKGSERLTAVDLFAGAGGLSVGLERAGFHVAAAVELDRHSAATFQVNHPAATVIQRDIRAVRAKDIRRASALSRTPLDLLTGCPPCQGFSTLRTRRRTAAVADPRNDLILEFLRLVHALRPRAVVLENVPGLAQDGGYLEFTRALEQLGYDQKAAVLDAAEYGVPQRRKRLVLVALRDAALPSGILTPPRGKRQTVRDAIGGLPPAGASGDQLHDVPERRTKAILSRIRATPHDGGSRGDLAARQQCRCHRLTEGFYDVYGRMRWDSPAPTITSGCTNPSKGRFLHPVEDRAITLREAALLQSFPPGYVFDLTRGKEHAAAQIGNAFPPKLITPIAKRLAKVLAG